MIYQTILENLFRVLYFFKYNEYNPTILFITLTVLGYIILNKIKKNILKRDTELAKHNMYKIYVKKTLQKVVESKLERSKLERSKLKRHTAYYFFLKEEWPKIRQEFKNYHYKELLQYLSLRWYIIKNNPLKLQKYEKMVVDNNSITQSKIN